MARYKNFGDGVRVQFTPEEETARDAEEKAWADAAPERELEAFYAKRRSEYPSLLELIVAIYEPEDRAAIDKRRADVKKKFPKPA